VTTPHAAVEFAAPAVVDRIARRSLIIGGAAALLCAVGAGVNPQQFFRSYLLGYMLWFGITLGCLALLMLQHLSGGMWGLVIRRQLEAATRNLPLMALGFLPVAIGMRSLYSWAAPGAQADELLRHKSAYLNPTAFLLRAALYFAGWWALSAMLSRWSALDDREPSTRLRLRFQGASGAGLVFYALTVTFASIDWVMSLNPHWSSTIYGVLFMGGQGLSALSFVIAISVLLARYPPMDRVLKPDYLHDLGKLLLAFVMLWAYFAFSQWLIIWSGNLTSEIPWYVARLRGGWQLIGLALIVFHFALPFMLLLSRDLKRRRRLLAGLASAILFMRWVDLYWLIAPNFYGQDPGLHLHGLDLLAPVAVGGIWMWQFFRQLKKLPLLPLSDPQLPQALELEHGRV